MSEEKVVASIGSSNNTVLLKLTEYEGHSVLDFRRYYRDKQTNALLPTRKGIALTERNYAFLKRAIELHDQEIGQWLARSSDVQSKKTMSLHASERLEQANRYQPREFGYEFRTWKSPEFFEVVCEGGEERAILNEDHAFIRSLKVLADTAPAAAEQVISMFVTLIIAYARAEQLFEFGRHPASDQILEMLRVNWGMYLSKYFR